MLPFQTAQKKGEIREKERISLPQAMFQQLLAQLLGLITPEQLVMGFSRGKGSKEGLPNCPGTVRLSWLGFIAHLNVEVRNERSFSSNASSLCKGGRHYGQHGVA